MKKSLVAILVTVLMVCSALFIVACKPADNTVKHKVTFYDGTTVLKEVEVENGKTVEAYTPEKSGGYEFVNWFSTPSFNHKFDFTKAVTENVSVFAGFTLYKEDARSFYVVGSGTSELLLGQDWGKNLNDSHKMTKTVDKNEYKITMDLLVGDEFQFAISSKWENKRGFGYLVTDRLSDGTVVFEGQGGGLGEVTSKGRNIKVVKEGNYTLTLKTYPNEDTYNTSDPSYTEEGKEVYNIGTFDTIEFVRNGDPLVATVVTTNYYIKGSPITGWADMYNSDTTMSKVGNTYTLVTYMKAGDQFMFASYNSSADGITAGSQYIKSNALSEESKTLIDGYSEAGGNMTTKKTGLHTFVYDNTTNVLSVTVDESATMPVYDYYLDGKTTGGLNWKAEDLPNNKLTETASGSNVFEIKNVQLAVGDEIIIRYYEKGTATPAYNNAKGIYNSPNLLPKLTATDDFSAASATNANIKAKTAGTYDISFDAYTKIIKIVTAEAQASAYVKGNAIESWGNKPESGKMTLGSDGKFTIELTMSVDDQIMIQYFAVGESSEWGAAFNSTHVEQSGAYASFDLTGNNIKCVTAGTYILTFDPTASKITIVAKTA